MRVRAESVNPRKLSSRLPVSAQNYRCSGDAHFGFSVKKFFWLAKNKIHFFLVDFSGGF
jgi:hypothetical protein